MVGNMTIDTTGTKNVPLKSIGNEKVKVSLCLTANVDGKKLKPLIVFPGAKCEATAMNEEFKNQCCGIILKRLDGRRVCFKIFEAGLRNVFL